MPMRPVCALIVLFWLATMGWFGYRDVWPRLRPSDTPPFVIELADEVTSQLPDDTKRTADVLWGIYRVDKDGSEKGIGRAQTRLRYDKDDHSFELQSRIIDLQLMPGVQIQEMINTYRLTERGELLAIYAKGKLVVLGLAGEARFEGVVHGGKLERKSEMTLPVLGKIVPELEPIEAPRGSILNPLHPIPRVKGLKPGRRWRMPVVNPLGDAVGPALLAVQKEKFPGAKPLQLNLPTGPKFLDAEVLSETALISYNSKMHECLIIEYRGDSDRLRTYVRKSDGLVLRQESEALGERFFMQRE